MVIFDLQALIFFLFCFFTWLFKKQSSRFQGGTSSHSLWWHFLKLEMEYIFRINFCMCQEYAQYVKAKSLRFIILSFQQRFVRQSARFGNVRFFIFIENTHGDLCLHLVMLTTMRTRRDAKDNSERQFYYLFTRKLCFTENQTPDTSALLYKTARAAHGRKTNVKHG